MLEVQSIHYLKPLKGVWHNLNLIQINHLWQYNYRVRA